MAQDFRERKRSWNKTSYDKTIVVQPFVAKKTFDAKVFFCQLLYVWSKWSMIKSYNLIEEYIPTNQTQICVRPVHDTSYLVWMDVKLR